jgi:hypothetical protein
MSSWARDAIGLVRPVDSAVARLRELAPALSGVEQRLRSAAELAGEGTGCPAPEERFLFVCADRLRNLAGRVSQFLRKAPELPPPPSEPERLAFWFRQIESDAARAGAWVRALEELSLSASLLALESSLALAGIGKTSRRLVAEIDEAADELSRSWAAYRQAAAELAWAAQDAAHAESRHRSVKAASEAGEAEN